MKFIPITNLSDAGTSNRLHLTAPTTIGAFVASAIDTVIPSVCGS